MLADFQRRFIQALRQPMRWSAEAIIANGLQPEQRMQIYRHHCQYVFTELLQRVYPKVYQLLGPARFSALAQAYTLAYPLRQPYVFEYGAALSDFMCQHADYRNTVLVTMARLEWSHQQCFYAAEQPWLAPESIAKLPPEQLQWLYLDKADRCQLVSGDDKTLIFWSQSPAEPCSASIPLAQGRQGLLVRRLTTGEITISALQPAHYCFLQTLCHDATLFEAYQAALLIDKDFAVQTVFQAALRDGVFMHYQLLKERKKNENTI